MTRQTPKTSVNTPKPTAGKSTSDHRQERAKHLATSALSVLLASTALAAGSLMMATPVDAACPGVIVGGETVADQWIENGQICTIEIGGVVDSSTGANDDAKKAGIRAVGVGNTVINNGDVINFTESGIRITLEPAIADEIPDGAALPTYTTVINNGTIKTGTIERPKAGSSGIVDNGKVSHNKVLNHGVIDLTGVGTRGISLFRHNEIWNTGTLTLIDKDGTSIFTETVHGIGFDSGNTVYNSGTISIVGSSYGVGVYTSGGDNNTLYNSGLIKAIPFDNIANPDSFDEENLATNDPSAILFEGYEGGGETDSNKIVLLPGSVVIGKIGLAASLQNTGNFNNNTLEVRNGLSIVWTLEKRRAYVDDRLENGFFIDPYFLPGTINTHSAPFAVDVANYKIAVVDPSLLAVADEMVADLTDASHGVVQGVINRSASDDAANTGGGGAGHHAGGTSAWLQGFGSRRVHQGQSPSVDTQHNTAGAVGGIEMQSEFDLTVGLFAGGSKTKVDNPFDTQNEDVTNYFGGIYSRYDLGSVILTGIVSGGKTSHERERVTNNNVILETEAIVGDASSATGLQTAKASFDSYYLAPEIGISTSVSISDRMTLVPSIQGRYIGYFQDGYAESGAADMLSVGKRTIHQVQGRVQLAANIELESNDKTILIAPKIGATVRNRFGSDTVTGTLLGQNIPFSPGGKKTVVSLLGGVTVEASLSNTLSAFANLEGSLEQHGTSRVSGGFGLKLRF